MQNGAVGGKLLGAGASGFMVFFAPPGHHAAIKEALPGYLHVPFRFETQGSTLIHYSSEN
jgi:D-glycero-alpha-D-manno-heptose-7-phosphate kinase